MRRKHLALAAIYGCVWLLKVLTANIFEESQHFEAITLMSAELPESTLALGQKLKLSSVGLYELELLPGVSDTLAQNILLSREKILNSAKKSISYERTKSLEMAHGVGEKTAKKLANYIALE